MSTGEPPNGASENQAAPVAELVRYLFFRADPLWRRQPRAARDQGRRELADSITATPGIESHAYSTLGLKSTASLLFWQKGGTPESQQELLARMLDTGCGQYLEVTHILFGLTRPSVYTKRRTAQEQALDEPDRLRYLIVYPFAKTTQWYLMSRDARQGMMNEHMRIGHEYSDVRQLLVYATGLDDQEFVVAYETNSLERHQQLVIDLRATEGRRYTLRDTPIFTAIHRPLDEALALLG